MNRFRRAVLIGLLGPALVAGPLAAACGDCCVKAEASRVIAAAPACCGHCAPTLERTPDPASITTHAAPTPDGAPGMGPPPRAASLIAASWKTPYRESAAARAAPSSAPLPLRL